MNETKTRDKNCIEISNERYINIHIQSYESHNVDFKQFIYYTVYDWCVHFVWNLGTPIRRVRYESGLRALSGKIEFPMGEQESRTPKKIILGSRCGNLRTIGHCQPTRWRVNVRWYRGAKGRKRGTPEIRQGGERNGRLCVRIRRVQRFHGPILS